MASVSLVAASQANPEPISRSTSSLAIQIAVDPPSVLVVNRVIWLPGLASLQLGEALRILALVVCIPSVSMVRAVVARIAAGSGIIGELNPFMA